MSEERTGRVRFDAPGVYDVDADTYHADPAPVPSLSVSIARKLTDESPRHAWQSHPRLGGGDDAEDESDDPNDAMDDGTVLHKLILGVGAPIEPIEVRYGPKHKKAGEIVRDWRTDAAKEAAAAARAAGRTPMLAHRLAELQAIADIALAQMRDHPGCAEFFAPGQSERMMLWQEGPVWCRSLVDRMPDDPAMPLFDLKTTKLSAAPQAWERRLEMEYALQAAFYMRGALATRGVAPAEFRFIVLETRAPYCISVMAPDADLVELAEQDMRRAVRGWHQCLAANKWPGYPAQVYYVTPSMRAMMRSEERAVAEAMAEQHEREMAEAARRTSMDDIIDGRVTVDWGG